MSVGSHMDVHIPYAVTIALRLRGVDVLTAQEDGTGQLEDPALLDRATEMERVLFSQDDDLLREATRRQRRGEHFSGVLYAHQLSITIGHCLEDLELIARASDPIEWINRVEYLPLK
ncbi:MAG: DUF5615 family PIN-like protein [Acidobacteria bacterium]|nr:DUF5615 family PIN-like protein [Acidobacteriota bacterium]